MKVTKIITTTEVAVRKENEDIELHYIRDFDGGKTAKKRVKDFHKTGGRACIYSVTKEKCTVEIPDSVVFENASITKVEK